MRLFWHNNGNAVDIEQIDFVCGWILKLGCGTDSIVFTSAVSDFFSFVFLHVIYKERIISYSGSFLGCRCVVDPGFWRSKGFWCC